MSYVYWAMSRSALRRIKTQFMTLRQQGGLLNSDLRRHWDRSCECATLLCVFVNLRWANNERCTIRWTSNLSRLLSVNTSISRHTVHHFYEGQVAMAVRRRHKRKWLMTPCLHRDTHSKTIGSIHTPFAPPKPYGTEQEPFIVYLLNLTHCVTIKNANNLYLITSSNWLCTKLLQQTSLVTFWISPHGAGVIVILCIICIVL